MQQVANETGYFVPKYGQDTRPQAPDGRMKLGKKPRNIGPHTCPDVPEGLGEKPIKGSGRNRTCKIRLACPQQPNLYLEPKWLRCKLFKPKSRHKFNFKQEVDNSATHMAAQRGNQKQVMMKPKILTG